MEAKFYMTESDYDYQDETTEANDYDAVDTTDYEYPTEEGREVTAEDDKWMDTDEPPF